MDVSSANACQQLHRQIDVVVRDYEDRHRKLQTEHDVELSVAGEKVSVLEKAVREKDEQLSLLKNKLQQAQKEVHMFAGAVEQLEHLRVQAEQLRQYHEQTKVKHKRHMHKAQEQQAELKGQLAARSSDLERCRQELQNVRAELSASLSDQKTTSHQLDAARTHATALSEKCGVLRQHAEQAECGRNSLQQQLTDREEHHRKQVDSLETKLCSAQKASNERLELTKNTLEEKLALVLKLTEENLALQRRVTEVSTVSEGIVLDNRCLKGQLEAATEQHRLLQSDSRRQSQKICELEATSQEKIKIICSLEEQKRKSAVELSSLRHEVQMLSQQLRDSKENESQLHAKLQQQSDRVMTLQQEFNAFRAEERLQRDPRSEQRHSRRGSQRSQSEHRYSSSLSDHYVPVTTATYDKTSCNLQRDEDVCVSSTYSQMPVGGDLLRLQSSSLPCSSSCTATTASAVDAGPVHTVILGPGHTRRDDESFVMSHTPHQASLPRALSPINAHFLKNQDISSDGEHSVTLHQGSNAVADKLSNPETISLGAASQKETTTSPLTAPRLSVDAQPISSTPLSSSFHSSTLHSELNAATQRCLHTTDMMGLDTTSQRTQQDPIISHSVVSSMPAFGTATISVTRDLSSHQSGNGASWKSSPPISVSSVMSSVDQPHLETHSNGNIAIASGNIAIASGSCAQASAQAKISSSESDVAESFTSGSELDLERFLDAEIPAISARMGAAMEGITFADLK